MFNTYTQQDDEILDHALLEIEKHFQIEPADLPAFSYQVFQVLKYYTNFLNRRTVRLTGTNTYAAFVEVEVTTISIKGLTVVQKYFQCYVFCYLPVSYGRVLIRKETIVDKIDELFHPVDIDFEDDKAFSKQFFVLATDKPKAVNLLSKNIRKAAINAGDDDLFIEVANKIVLIGNKQTVNVKTVLEMVTLGIEIGREKANQ